MIQKTKDKIFTISRKWGRKIGIDLPYFLKNGFWVAVRQLVSILGGLILSAVFARMATQEIFGQYQFILAVLSIVSILSVPGLNVSITRSVARGYEGDYARVVKTSFLWSLLGVPVLLLAGGYYYLYQSYGLGLALMISSVFFPFLYAPNTWDSFLQGKSRFDISAKYSSIQAILNTAVTVVVIFFSRNNLVPIVIAYLVSYTFFNGYYYFKSLKYVNNKKTDADTVNYGFFLTKVSLLTIIGENMDKIIIGAFISPSALAAYYVISVIPLKIKDSLKPFVNLFLPKFSIVQENISDIVKQKKKVIFFFIVTMILAAALYYALIEKINLIIFGKQYLEYYHYSKYFAVLIFLSIPLNILARYVLGVKDRISIIFSNVIYPIVRIIVIIALTFKYSLFGAVLAYNINLVLMLLLYLAGIRISQKNKTK